LKNLITVISLIFSFQLLAKVYFSPVDILDQVVVQEIQKATQSIEMSIYTFNSPAIRDAMVQKVGEGVKIRILVHRGNNERTQEFVKPLQHAGVQVRYVSKINHHKFFIVDGQSLYSSSGNFSESKRQRSYDENSIVCGADCAALVDSFTQEFEWLWAFSREVSNELPVDELPQIFKREQGEDAFFTSYNFTPYVRGDYVTFRTAKSGGVVAKALVKAIDAATDSIKVATGHFRSYPLYLALKKAVERGVKVTVVLDSQEYISSYWQEVEDQKIQECLDKGKSDEFCHRTGVHFSRKASIAGVKVYIKYYSIRWFFPKAPQMHHKYLIIDDKRVYTGSYNWSFNAEFNTFENVSVIDDPKFVDRFNQNFTKVKNYGRKISYLKFLSQFKGSGPIPLFFTPKTLLLKKVDKVRDAVFARCPELGLLDIAESTCKPVK
jgi:phosphatidylserine/phosphatidylglycerophosphate/cardiolipin synthase-like enzyme